MAEKAIALDPGVRDAVRVARHLAQHSRGPGWSPISWADNAEVFRLATAAIARDSFDAMALALCGHTKSILRYEFEEAMLLFDRAIAARPSSAIAGQGAARRIHTSVTQGGDPPRRGGAAPVPSRSAHFLPHTILVLGALRRRGVRRSGPVGTEGARREPAVHCEPATSRRQPGRRREHGRKRREVGQALLGGEPRVRGRSLRQRLRYPRSGATRSPRPPPAAGRAPGLRH